MRKLKILGMEYALPKQTILFGYQTRYRISNFETHLSLSVEATKKLLNKLNLKIDDIDLIIGACAVPYQLIPNMSSIVYEQIYGIQGIPCIDINTTCTSFITALDTASYFIDAGKYKRILIISSDVPSKALNKSDKKTYELFSDCATATIVEGTEEDRGIIYSVQKTFPSGVHDTEIPASASRLTVHEKNDANTDLFYFKMNGIKVVKNTLSNVAKIYQEIVKKIEDISFVVPHQASSVLDLFIKKAGIELPYINIVKEYGNMVSASIPFAFIKAIELGKIRHDDKVLLLGTAAGLTINALVLKY